MGRISFTRSAVLRSDEEKKWYTKNSSAISLWLATRTHYDTKRCSCTACDGIIESIRHMQLAGCSHADISAVQAWLRFRCIPEYEALVWWYRRAGSRRNSWAAKVERVKLQRMACKAERRALKAAAVHLDRSATTTPLATLATLASAPLATSSLAATATQAVPEHSGSC